jgi:RNA polymerase II subunit A small phosphatase-like protein
MSNYNKKSQIIDKKKSHNNYNPFKSTNYRPTITLYNQKNKNKKIFNINSNSNIQTKQKKTFSLSPLHKNTLLINSNKTPIKKEKALAIDLDESIIHSSFEPFENPDYILPIKLNMTNNILNDDSKNDSYVYINIRPGFSDFLNSLSNYYEIYIFTAASADYAEPIINLIDPDKIIKKSFFREDCTLIEEETYIKDLNKLNKFDIKDIVLIDNNIISFLFQKENGIPIKSWYDDYNDIELYKLIPILKNLSGFYDVRTEIKKFVKENTFIWIKAINWIKENLLNLMFLKDIECVIQIEKKTFEKLNYRLKKSKNKLNEKSNKKKNDFIKITNNFFYESHNNSNIKIEDEFDNKNNSINNTLINNNKSNIFIDENYNSQQKINISNNKININNNTNNINNNNNSNNLIEKSQTININKKNNLNSNNLFFNTKFSNMHFRRNSKIIFSKKNKYYHLPSFSLHLNNSLC